jgi:hypothetical protein
MTGRVYAAMTAAAQWIMKVSIVVIPVEMNSASAALRIAIPAMRLYVLAAALSVQIVVNLSAINA